MWSQRAPLPTSPHFAGGGIKALPRVRGGGLGGGPAKGRRRRPHSGRSIFLLSRRRSPTSSRCEVCRASLALNPTYKCRSHIDADTVVERFSHWSELFYTVMPGLDPGIHVRATTSPFRRGWPGLGPAMTVQGRSRHLENAVGNAHLQAAELRGLTDDATAPGPRPFRRRSTPRSLHTARSAATCRAGRLRAGRAGGKKTSSTSCRRC